MEPRNDPHPNHARASVDTVSRGIQIMSRIKKLGILLAVWPLLTAFIYFNQGTGASIVFGACGALFFCSELIDYIHEKNTGEPYFQWSKKKDDTESYFDGGGGFDGDGGGGGD